ncbi:MAG: hypothetical protein R2710_24310 [Acidimicrobiales bacterium]
MSIIANHPDVDAIIYLGLGIQSNQARMMKEGRSTPTTGWSGSSPTTNARTPDSPKRPTDPRATGKPILTATELAIADPDNPGPAAVRASGRLCYATANRAVTALEHLYRYSLFQQR